MIHGRKWGWKRLAARLLLIPVIGGWSAAAHAQPKAGAGPLGATAPAAGMPKDKAAPKGPDRVAEAKALLKDGRKALDAGQLDRAQDLARAAENANQKWGLFDDTPASLLKDVQAAVAKAQRTQAELLTKEAKGLLAKPAKGDAEKAGNLDRAYALAERANQLHGPYSAWDFGDRPDKMMKEIKAARDKIKSVPPGAGAGAAVADAGRPAFPTAGAGTGAPKPPAGADAKKAQAVQLMGEGKKLADAGQYAAARAKLAEADRLGAEFGRTEYAPGDALQELSARGSTAADKLVAEAKARAAQKDYAKADAALTEAAAITSALGLFSKPIDDARAQLKAAQAGPAPAAVAANTPTSPMAPVGPMSPAAPPAEPGSATVGSPASVTAPVAAAPADPKPAAGGVTGKQLLEQAAYEFSREEYDTAGKLAMQAHNLGGVQEEARGLLNSIDAARLRKKTEAAVKSFEAARQSAADKAYGRALDVLILTDAKLLPADLQAKHADLVKECREALAKPGTGVVTAGGTQEPAAPPTTSDAPPAARTAAEPKAGDYASQVAALKQAEVVKLRQEGNAVETKAREAFGKGDTDLAMQMLMDHATKVRNAGLSASTVSMLLTRTDALMGTFKVMKGHTEAVTRVNREAKEVGDAIAGRGLADDQRRVEVKGLVAKYRALADKKEWDAAERVALQAKQLDPDDPALAALATMARNQGRLEKVEKNKANNERMVFEGLLDAERQGPIVTNDQPLSIQLDRSRLARTRGPGNDAFLKTMTPSEYDIEQKLSRPMSVEFNQTPLSEAIKHFQVETGLPIVIDYAKLDLEGLSAAKPITVAPGKPVSTRNLLSFAVEQAGMAFVVENDLVKVTTTKHAKGRLMTKVFSVADLVTPIPNFALPDYANFDKMLKADAVSSGRAHIQGLSGTTPFVPQQGLGGGAQASMPGSMATSPGIGGGRLDTQGWGGAGPLAGTANLAGERNTKHEQLIKLITGMVRPYSWDGMGGAGRVEYFDIGSALVVNQVADVIQEVADLLEALRRLQDLAIAVEIRIVSLSETFFERLGVDFSFNIKTHNTQFEPALTQVDPNTGFSGVFRPLPFINDNRFEGVTAGLTPAGTLTGDLNVPIRVNNFNRAIPPFGGYPNTPGDNGGISFGLAFLNDIQVFLFLEAAQGDRRVNVMQAPKLTLFNGQTATLSVTDQSFFVTNVTVISVNGQLVFVPNNTLLPGPDTNFSIGIQAVVSADRRFVRLNLPVQLAAQSGAVVPLFPITTFVTPVFEGGSQGLPIPFTQFLQQPAFTTLNIQTTVVCPDGGTVLLGGLKTLQEGRNEFGPPVLSKIPYLNRLFKNVGIGRETRHIMIMVTPRIIINSEEEIFQTEGRPPFGGGGGQP